MMKPLMKEMRKKLKKTMKMMRSKNLMRKKATMMMDEKKAERSGHESQ